MNSIVLAIHQQPAEWSRALLFILNKSGWTKKIFNKKTQSGASVIFYIFFFLIIILWFLCGARNNETIRSLNAMPFSSDTLRYIFNGFSNLFALGFRTDNRNNFTFSDSARNVLVLLPWLIFPTVRTLLESSISNDIPVPHVSFCADTNVSIRFYRRI